METKEKTLKVTVQQAGICDSRLTYRVQSITGAVVIDGAIDLDCPTQNIRVGSYVTEEVINAMLEFDYEVTIVELGDPKLVFDERQAIAAKKVPFKELAIGEDFHIAEKECTFEKLNERTAFVRSLSSQSFGHVYTFGTEKEVMRGCGLRKGHSL